VLQYFSRGHLKSCAGRLRQHLAPETDSESGTSYMLRLYVLSFTEENRPPLATYIRIKTGSVSVGVLFSTEV
jgi:hypothetical protein